MFGAARLHELQSLQRVHALEIGALGFVFLRAISGRGRRLHGLGKLAPRAFLGGGDFQLGFELIQPLDVALARLAFAFFRLAGGARSGGGFAAGGHLGVGGSAQESGGGGDQKNAFGGVAHEKSLSFRESPGHSGMKGSVAGACFGFFRRPLKFCKGRGAGALRLADN